MDSSTDPASPSVGGPTVEEEAPAIGAGDKRAKGQINAIKGAPQPHNVTASPATPGGTPAPEVAGKVTQEKADQSSIDLYGFVMLDSGYDFKTNNQDWFDVMRPTKLPSFSGEFAPDGKAYFGVRQTRFGVKTSTPTGLGTLKTQFEFELFGTGVDAGQTTFRLRRAYGEQTFIRVIMRSPICCTTRFRVSRSEVSFSLADG